MHCYLYSLSGKWHHLGYLFLGTVFKEHVKIAALLISSKIPVLSISSAKSELFYRTMGCEGRSIISFSPFTWKSKLQVTNYWRSSQLSTPHPSELLVFTKTWLCIACLQMARMPLPPALMEARSLGVLLGEWELLHVLPELLSVNLWWWNACATHRANLQTTD